MAEFKAGDVVQLKSGGPLMTIKWIDGTEALCEWFEGSKKQEQMFEMTSLRQSAEPRL